MISRYSARFSLMVVGPKGCGKTSFFNNMVGKSVVKDTNSEEINIYMLNLDCEGIMQRITFVDTPGFDSENDSKVQNNIVNYIKEQFDAYMAEENKIRRNPKYEDTRVHCLLYFLPASTFGMKSSDLSFLKQVKSLVNIIPVISKADGLIPEEIIALKSLIKKQFSENQIPIFNLDSTLMSPKADIGFNLNQMAPFTIINGEEKVKAINGFSIEIDNPHYNDLSTLREIVLSSHLESFVSLTSEKLYEEYRAITLESAIDQ